MINGRRDILSLKILRGIANTGEILAQLIFEYQVYSETAEKIAVSYTTTILIIYFVTFN